MARKYLIPIDMNKNEIQNQRVHNLGSAPGSPVLGQIYYDTGTNKMYYWNGAWIDTTGGVTSFATPAIVLGTAAAAGVATTAIRSDSTIVAFDATAPGTSAVGDAAAVGSIAFAARRDHVHGREAFATNAVILGTAAANGAATTHIRSDATIAAFDATNPSTQAFADAAAVGSAAFAARRDHKHAMPSHTTALHQEMLATADLTDWPRVAALDLASQKITSLLDPTAAQDAATKAYVDSVASGLDVHPSVRAATTANVTVAGSAPNTLDGVTLAASDRILVKNQTTPAENGLYTVTTLGTGANGTWTRATDADVSAEVTSGLFVFVEEGTLYADTGWVLSTNNPITLNTTGLTFVQFSGAGSWTAGTGMTQTGTTLNVIAGTGMVANADDMAVLRTDANGRVPLRYSVLIGDGSTTAITVTHNLNTLDVICQVYEVSGGLQVEPDITHATVNTLTITFTTAPTSNQFKCVVIG